MRCAKRISSVTSCSSAACRAFQSRAKAAATLGANGRTLGRGRIQSSLCHRWCGRLVKPPVGRSASIGRPSRSTSTTRPSASSPRP
ncbi:MAG: hypothetical protein ACK56I_13905 [bacterium]